MIQVKKGVMSKVNHIIMIIDRSGSMANVAPTVNEDIRKFVRKQKRNAPFGTLFSAVLFDDQYDVIYDRINIDDVKRKPLQLVPRGNTALNDAIMKAVSSVKDEDALIMIVTDGQENASKEASQAQVTARLKELTDQGCSVIYMSSAKSAILDSKRYSSTITVSSSSLNNATYAATMDTASKSYYSRGDATAAQANLQASGTMRSNSSGDAQITIDPDATKQAQAIADKVATAIKQKSPSPVL